MIVLYNNPSSVVSLFSMWKGTHDVRSFQCFEGNSAIYAVIFDAKKGRLSNAWIFHNIFLKLGYSGCEFFEILPQRSLESTRENTRDLQVILLHISQEKAPQNYLETNSTQRRKE